MSRGAASPVRLAGCTACIIVALSLALEPATAGTKTSEPPKIDTVAVPASTGKPDEAVNATAPSIASSLGPYADPGGIRARLDKAGFTYDLTYIGEVFGNPTGGLKQGAAYFGRLDVNLNFDLGKLAHLDGLTAHAEAFQIHGRPFSAFYTLDLFSVSGLQAVPATRIFELWLEKEFLGGKLLVRGGQLAADTEFVVSQTASLFIGASYGWPGSFGNNLPGGGPVYPVGATGLRIKAQPIDHLTLLGAIFNGDGTGAYDPSADNVLPRLTGDVGLPFRIGDPPLLLGEAQYDYEIGASALPGVAKIGYFHHFDRFAATNRPFRPGVTYSGNDGGYAIIDQSIYREPNNPQNGAATFLRATYNPADRNLFDVYVDGGITYKGLLPNRPNDTTGLDFAYGHISPDVTRSDVVTGSAPLVRDYQALIEATYQMAVLPGVTVQPDFQYIFHPGAHGIGLPRSGLPLPDAAVFGLRASVHY